MLTGLFAVSSAQAAPTSTLYITGGDSLPNALLITVQGGRGTITTTPMQAYIEQAIAITGTIKTLSINPDTVTTDTGYQYTLNGTFTGTTYPAPAAVQNAYF